MTDIKALKAAHPLAETIGRYIELKPNGAEFSGLCPFHHEDTPSFTVVPNKDFFYCFGCGAGGDVIDFLCQWHGIDKELDKGWIQRVSELIGHQNIGGPSIIKQVIDRAAVEKWTPIVPVPADAPAIMPKGSVWTAKIHNPKRADTPGYKPSGFKPSKIYTYRNQAGVVGYVLRCQFADGKKFTPQVTYCQDDAGNKQWCIVPMPTPRPLYGLMDLVAKPAARVIIVEGEKCKAAAEKLFPDYVALSWAGGTNGWKSTDWAPVAGRQVILWPDADGPGRETMQAIASDLHARDCHVLVVSTEGLADGWDCADALEKEGWTPKKTMDWIKPRAKKYTPPRKQEPAPAVTQQPPPIQKPAAPPKPKQEKPKLSVVGNTAVKQQPEEKPEHWHQAWQNMALDLNHSGSPLNNLNNATKIILSHKEFAGRFWYDEFHCKYFTTWDGHEREIQDPDILKVTIFIQNSLGIRRMADDIVKKAIIAAGRHHIRNEPQEWLNKLQWDGVKRVKGCFQKYFGADNTRYTADASQNFWISMVARVLEPGCQVDNVVILECKQGAGKTSALRVIGGKYYTEAHESITSKDFFLSLQGRFLIEIGEMEAFSRAEMTKVKQVVTCRTDRFRAPYARSSEDHMRQCIFTATSNDIKLTDYTGARRFWPIKCGDVLDHQRLQLDREQLFAEAVSLYKDGEPWYKIEGAEEEQEKRRVSDEWEYVISHNTVIMQRCDMADVLKWLGIEIGKAEMSVQHRIGRCMRVLGWERKSAGKAGEGMVWEKRG